MTTDWRTDLERVLSESRYRRCLLETRNPNVPLDQRMAALTTVEEDRQALRALLREALDMAGHWLQGGSQFLSSRSPLVDMKRAAEIRAAVFGESTDNRPTGEENRPT